MPSLHEPPSSPPDASSSSLESLLAYYKSNYEQLELELADFQASSRELETELEKDVDAAEKRERKLREKVEGLGYEVDEWKTKYKQCKTEANAAQNALQKEITVLRDSNRTMQLKLRDIEVANDDFERQARNTTSSLEDLESKYNVAIERAVMLEAEVQTGEQEREALRIETQRLRDELSDLKIEADITQGKLRHQEEATERERDGQVQSTTLGVDRPQSPSSDRSAMTATSSPTVSTPPRPKSASTATTSEAPTPPSPAVSEKSAGVAGAVEPCTTTPSQPAKAAASEDADTNTTPRPSHFQARPTPARHSRAPSNAIPRHPRTPSTLPHHPTNARLNGARTVGLPQSGSLRQIRGLIGQVAKLEQRVHSARSKLPAPIHTPPHASPRSDSSQGHHGAIPASVTVRSHKKRATGSTASRSSSVHDPAENTAPYSTRPVSRLSFGVSANNPPAAAPSSRPSSRASISSRTSINANGNTSNTFQRPSSRASLSGARTPLGHYPSSSTSNTASEQRRPRSSIGGSYAAAHGHSASVSGVEDRFSGRESTTTPIARRSLLGKADLDGATGIPTPTGIPKRQSGGAALKQYGGLGMSMTPTQRRTSSGMSARRETGGEGVGEMGPPERKKKLSGVGETF